MNLILGNEADDFLMILLQQNLISGTILEIMGGGGTIIGVSVMYCAKRGSAPRARVIRGVQKAYWVISRLGSI